MAKGFYEDLVDENISFSDFCLFVRSARKTSKFFPKMSQILEERDTHNKEMVWRKQKRHPLLEEPEQTPEEIARNIESLEVIKRMLSGELSMYQAQAQQEILRRK